MTVRAWLSRETEQTSGIWMLAVGTLCTVCYLVIRTVCGSPYRMILELGIADLIPPVWLFTVLQTLAFFTVGCAAGLVLGDRSWGCAAEKYKGGMFFVLTVTMELCRYPTLFCGGMVFLTLCETLLGFGVAILTTVSFFKVCRFSGILFVLHDVWLFYLVILSFRIFLRN